MSYNPYCHLSPSQRQVAMQSTNPVIIQALQKGDIAQANGNYLEEVVNHRYILENTSPSYDKLSQKAWNFNCEYYHRYPEITTNPSVGAEIFAKHGLSGRK
jgi:hypothetical protein